MRYFSSVFLRYIELDFFSGILLNKKNWGEGSYLFIIKSHFLALCSRATANSAHIVAEIWADSEVHCR